jgi:manganese transport protein
MGEMVAPLWLTGLSWAIAALIIGLNIKLLWDILI